ncbi:hypothetical protein F511_21223 [Dorcoceras hygrometricum]|uniref:Uncharacterized protein n=1 Tax=Dorcoceras hygrometricum TaxID=472368 RepID=A0A2Z7BL75_9LAMI|nr:hypothetical protein F511_21223 [Dorcoceras hygrometricum]
MDMYLLYLHARIFLVELISCWPFDVVLTRMYQEACIEDERQYRAPNLPADVEGVADESRVNKTPMKKAVSKEIPATSVDEHISKKKRTTVGKAAKTVLPSKPKRKAPKRRLKLPVESDDEIVEEETTVGVIAEKDSVPARADVVDQEISTADDVDNIIEQLIAETAQFETDFGGTNVGETNFGDQAVQRADEMEHWFNVSYEEFVDREADRMVESGSDTNEEIVTDKVTETDVGETASEERVVAKKNAEFLCNKPTDEELMTIDDLLMQIYDDMMLPSVTAAKVTKIKFGLSVEINEVQNKDCYYVSLPQISATDKGKEPLEEVDVVKGNPAREMVLLICGDVEFLVQLREQKKEHGLIWERPCSSSLCDDSVDGDGAVLAQFYSLAKSTCWMPERDIEDSFVPHCYFIEPDQYWGASQSIIKTRGWFRVCTDIIRYSMFGCLCPVGSVNSCRDIVVKSSVVDILEAILSSLINIGEHHSLSSKRGAGSEDIVVKSSVVDILEKVPTGFCDVIQQGKDTNSFIRYFSDSVGKPVLQCLPEVELVSSDGSTVSRSPSHQSLSSSSDQLYFHLSSPVDEEVIATTDVRSTPTVAQLSLPPVVSESFDDLRAYISRIIINQSKESRMQDQDSRSLIQSVRQENHNETDVLSLALKAVRAQNAILSTDLEDVRKEVKEQKAIIEDMDERLATVRRELLDFRAQAQENHNTLSTQFGFLVDYINRVGNDKKGKDSSSRRPQPLPDDQDRPSGGSASRGSGGDGSSRRRDDRGRSSKKRHPSSCDGGSGSGRVTYGPYLPPTRDAKWWVLGERQF